MNHSMISVANLELKCTLKNTSLALYQTEDYAIFPYWIYSQTKDSRSLAQLPKFSFVGTENIAGKGENAGNQHFLLFPQYFQKSFLLQVVKIRDCVKKGKSINVRHYFQSQTQE